MHADQVGQHFNLHPNFKLYTCTYCITAKMRGTGKNQNVKSAAGKKSVSEQQAT